MMQSEVLNLRTQWDWLPDIGLQMGIPLVLIIVTLVVRGETLPTRATLAPRSVPRAHRDPSTRCCRSASWPQWEWLPCSSSTRRGDRASSSPTVSALIALSIVVLTGYVGQISLMPMAFAGISAFAMIKLSTSAHLGFPLAPAARLVVGRRGGPGRGHPGRARPRHEPRHRHARRRGRRRGARPPVELVHRWTRRCHRAPAPPVRGRSRHPGDRRHVPASRVRCAVHRRRHERRVGGRTCDAGPPAFGGSPCAATNARQPQRASTCAR